MDILDKIEKKTNKVFKSNKFKMDFMNYKLCVSTFSEMGVREFTKDPMERKTVSHVLLVLLLLQQFRSVNTFYGLDMKCLNWKFLLIAATSVFLPG